jgi:uncharacterized protein YndB with AHSA1/START domain
MKWLMIVVGILAASILVVLAIGAILPKQHTVTRKAHYRQPPAAIWQAITDYNKFPEWRKGVERVEALPAGNGQGGWVEYVKGAGRIPLEITESAAPQRLVVWIADPNLPFGGTWTYDIAAAANGSTLRITENGEVGNPLFRFVSQVVFGLRATIDQYLKDLGGRFGETTQLEN